MSNHYIAINHGVAGRNNSDFTLGTSSSAATDVEVRIADVDANGNVMTRKDVIVALQNIIYAIQNRLSTFPPL
jgi:hypothetical protein